MGLFLGLTWLMLAWSASATSLVELEVPGFEPALVALPEPAEPLPLVVVTHGAGGNAEWHCAHALGIFESEAILLCPRGKRRHARDPSQGYYYPDHLALARELHHSLVAFAARFPGRLGPAGPVYVGYSQGATMGLLALPLLGAPFRAVALLEGGTDPLTTRMAAQLAQEGLTRALFVCGTRHCEKATARNVAALDRAGILLRAHLAAGAGHRPDGAVGERLRAEAHWLLASPGEP
jgi:predicted esterase